MGKLTTHVLDIVSGKPGTGIGVGLRKGGVEIAAGVTNGDGRLDGALVEEGEGEYELEFSVGEYFARMGYEAGIFRVVVIRFQMEREGAYHVPLVCTPWAYSTYRGS